MKKLIINFIILTIVLLTAAGCAGRGSDKDSSATAAPGGSKSDTGSSIIDYADVFTINGIHYLAAHEEVITDEKIIGKEVGSIKFTLYGSNVGAKYQMKDGDATFLKVGTKIYSLRNMDSKEAVAAQNSGKWILYRAVQKDSNWTRPSGNGITEETYKATAMIVEKADGREQVKIEDKEKIKKVLDGIKLGTKTTEDINSPEGNRYSFYFVVPDKKGIGQIVYRYYLNFQDINLNGYVRRFDDIYKVDSSINKIIAENFGESKTVYDSKLGGKQQIYEMYADGKFILRKVVKETPAEKFNVKIIKQGEDIWQNGSRVKDTLPGKYKIEIFMKDTKLQQQILNIFDSKQYKVFGVSSISYTTADEGSSSVLYLSCDKQPDLYLDENADSFVLFSKE